MRICSLYIHPSRRESDDRDQQTDFPSPSYRLCNSSFPAGKNTPSPFIRNFQFPHHFIIISSFPLHQPTHPITPKKKNLISHHQTNSTTNKLFSKRTHNVPPFFRALNTPFITSLKLLLVLFFPLRTSTPSPLFPSPSPSLSCELALRICNFSLKLPTNPFSSSSSSNSNQLVSLTQAGDGGAERM